MKKKPLKSYFVIVDADGGMTPMQLLSSYHDRIDLNEAQKLIGKLPRGMYTITVEKKFLGLRRIYRYEGRPMF